MKNYSNFCKNNFKQLFSIYSNSLAFDSVNFFKCLNTYNYRNSPKNIGRQKTSLFVDFWQRKSTLTFNKQLRSVVLFMLEDLYSLKNILKM